MKQFHITEIVTKDKLVHQGIYFAPKRKDKVAILWVHGLTDNFYGDLKLMEELSVFCEKEGWGLASFNNRGHDIISSITKLDPTTAKGKTNVTIGSSYEKFSECVLDIDAGITFLAKQGFSEIIISGISTGANKVCFYEGTKHDKRVVGVILASPVSDPSTMITNKRYSEMIRKAKEIRNSDKLLDGFDWFPLTPKRFLSLYDIGGEEDTFPYYQKKPQPKALQNITKPVLVILGGSDEWADRPVKEIVEFFRKFNHSKNFKSAIIPAAFHSYGGKEKQTAQRIADWVKTL